MHSLGAASTPIPPIHRWSSVPRWRKSAAARGLDPAQRAYLHDVRWRRLPASRAEVALVLAATLLLHALAMIGASYNMRVRPMAAAPTVQRHVIQVELIERSPAAAPSPPPPQKLPDMQVRAPGRPATETRSAPEPVAPPPPPVQEAPNPKAAAAELFDRRGRVILPAGAASSGSGTPEYQAGILHSDSKPAEPQSPIKYKPTRFEKDWAPANENVLQKAVRKTLIEGTVMKLPGGVRVKCALSPLALAGGCGLTGPEQLSAPLHVEFKRNNLPSATPLIKPTEASSSPGPAQATSVAPVPGSSAPRS